MVYADLDPITVRSNPTSDSVRRNPHLAAISPSAYPSASTSSTPAPSPKPSAPPAPIPSRERWQAVSFAVNSEAGLKKLDEYLLTRSYITGYQASKDDLAVYSSFSAAPSSKYINVARWFNHIDALVRLSGITEAGQGVKVESSAVAQASTPDVADAKAPAADDDDDDDVDLFGEETEEEKAAAEARAAAVKASGKKKESGKSSVLLDVKPWDDETDMAKLEEAVRSVKMDGLLWGACMLPYAL
ncbi:hypothetical protein PR202_ga29201 [Eleusine coracana subsp. coracana]|uniref:Translation elongation factor EF1B beta/delta subunit guanine nucleotide exchange domain-containing protein n=1 Tax=Eleusine coracana subsp. coracana TaxID=191504 RepID=A0AAV5DKJ8_ELECO|nr:hypothetical protein PR202_ga29201 [Eleusine coracana subsp. coracana]